MHLSSVRGETEHKNYGSMVCHIIEAPENNKKKWLCEIKICA